MTAPETGASPRGVEPAHSPERHESGLAPGGVVPIRPERIRKRRDFLAAARARRWSAPGFLLQGRQRREGEPAAPGAVRVGFTCSKKVGDAVRRNRAKRRLRAIADALLPQGGRPGWDYVLIGKADVTASRDFNDLLSDLELSLQRIHEPKPRR
ncbi:MAG: ribonuclease P protein component [Pikeienuella sp.]